MDLTQQSVLSFLIEEGGKVKKSELVRRFKGSTDCDDPAERERNRDLFKNLVNSVAVVKEIDGARFVVVRKKYEPLVESYKARDEAEEAEESAGHASGDVVDAARKGEPQRPPAPGDGGGLRARSDGERGGNLPETINPIEVALQRCKYDVKLKRGMHFDIQNEDGQAKPLRSPTKVEIHKIKSNDAPRKPKFDPTEDKTFAKSVQTGANAGSPSLKRATKSAKVSTEKEEKETRSPSLVPLEQTEHEWLVKCASGHWSQVYGLLMRDSQLAEKKDFISGFTALHWAAKFGNSDMLAKIFEVSKRGGVEVDVNAKARGGYTPLHIAALHDQEYVLAMLVGEYGADAKIRDNGGRRAHHYLHKGVSQTVKEMLGQPKPASNTSNDDKEVRVSQSDKEEQDVFTDLSKGLHSISKLFQPTLTGHKRKSKQRPSLYSLQDEPEMEAREEGRHRLQSDVFM